MHKENEVKYLKDLIKGLGANKTTRSIIAVTKAAPAIESIVSNFNKMVSLESVTSTHKHRSREIDVLLLVDSLKKMSPWKIQNNRCLDSFKSITASPFTFSLDHFEEHVMSTANRLFRDLPDDDEDE